MVLGVHVSHLGTELDQVIVAARANGSIDDPVTRQRLVVAWIGLRLMRFTAMRTLSAMDAGGGEPGPEASINKLFWATWHRNLGELAMDVLGADATLATDGGEGAAYEDALTAFQRLFLFTLRHDLRRVQPDPAQHHRRAGARAAQGAQQRQDPAVQRAAQERVTA